MKIGIEVRIDVTKIDKARLYKGAKGTYLTMTTFIDTDNPDQYDNNGFISHKQTKEESDSKTYTPILGNCKVFYKDKDGGSQHVHQQGMQQAQEAVNAPQQPQQPQQQPQAQQQAQQALQPQQQEPQQIAPGYDDFKDVPFFNPYKNMEYLV